MKVKCKQINDFLTKKYLTENKEYEVVLKMGDLLIIKDDDNSEIAITIDNCMHIKSDWNAI